MSSPYRVHCPPEAEAPEVEHPYARVLRAQRIKTRLLAAGTLTAAAVALVAIASTRSANAQARRAEVRARVTEVERERVATAKQAIEDARRRAHEAQARFEHGLEEARARGDGALATCPPRGTLAGRKPTLSVVEDAAHGLPSRIVDDVLADARRAEIHVDAGRFEDAAAYGRALSSPNRFGRELVVVARETKAPQVRSMTSYVPGEVTGRAYLWDFEEGRVLCAADVHATSSQEIGFSYLGAPDAKAESGRTSRLMATLSDDLTRAVERAATEALFASR